MSFHELSECDNLIDRIQRLPPELYSEIYDLTFTVNVETRRIDRFYNPLSILQVNQKWRNALSPAYYEQNTFITTDKKAHLDYLTRWLTSLTPKERKHVARSGIQIHSERKLQHSDPGLSAEGALWRDELTVENKNVLLTLKACVPPAIVRVEADLEEQWAIVRSIEYRVLTDSGRETWWDWRMGWSREDTGLRVD